LEVFAVLSAGEQIDVLVFNNWRNFHGTWFYERASVERVAS
jgi:hypothetical protein